VTPAWGAGRRFPCLPIKPHIPVQGERAEFKGERPFLKKRWLLTGSLGMKKMVTFSPL
jgi:hypothetical protein